MAVGLSEIDEDASADDDFSGDESGDDDDDEGMDWDDLERKAKKGTLGFALERGGMPLY